MTLLGYQFGAAVSIEDPNPAEATRASCFFRKGAARCKIVRNSFLLAPSSREQPQ